MPHRIIIRIKESGTKGYGSFEYKNEVSVEDWKLLALLLLDLERYDANIDKAFREYKRLKSQDSFPF